MNTVVYLFPRKGDGDDAPAAGPQDATTAWRRFDRAVA